MILFFVLQLHQILKSQTTSAHQVLEKRLVTYLRNMRTISDYNALLRVYYGFIQPLENAVEQNIGNDILMDGHHRCRHSLLLNDINNLQPTGMSLMPAPIPTFVFNQASALGALYVLEGSTLGGRFIVEMIRKKIGIGQGYSYFNGYGVNNEAMWSSFLLVLQKEYPTAFAQQVAQAATETFKQFDLWLQQNLQPFTAHV